VAILDAAGEGLEDRAHGEAAAACVDRDAVGLAHQRAVGAGDEAGEVVALVEDRAARGARHHPAHLPGDVVEPLLRQRKLDRIERGHAAPTVMSKLPLASTARMSPGPTTTVVVASSTISGPVKRWPGARSAPAKTGVSTQPAA